MDPIPDADAIVAVGHVRNYLVDEAAVERAWVAIARALRPRGVLAMDVCDLEWGAARASAPPYAQVTDEWAVVTRCSLPSPARFVRDITVFVRERDERWRRDDERHENVLLETAAIPLVLARYGVEATVRSSFGTERLPVGMKAIVGK